MLVGEDHVGGEESCGWERTMLAVEDSEFSRIVIFVHKNTLFA